MQHVVTRLDSPWSLAVKHTGEGGRWRELCAANPNLPKHQKYGCVFRVGEAINIPASWTGGTSPAPTSPTASPTASPTSPTSPTSAPSSALPSASLLSREAFGLPYWAIGLGVVAVAAGGIVWWRSR
jgi:hypothetical protein